MTVSGLKKAENSYQTVENVIRSNALERIVEKVHALKTKQSLKYIHANILKVF